MKWAGRALALWLPLAVSISFPCIAARALLRAQRSQRSSVARIDTLIEKGRDLLASGHVSEAAPPLVHAAELARRAGSISRESYALLTLSACRIRLFDYRGAEQAAEDARSLAFKTGDNDVAGAATSNIASIYLQLGDYHFAGKEASRAADLLKRTAKKDRFVKALLLYADAEAERLRNKLEAEKVNGDTEAERRDIEQLEQNYQHGIDVASAFGLTKLEAKLSEELGYSLLLAQLPQRAEQPLRAAYVLESNSHDEDGLANNKEHQAELQLQKKNYRYGLDLINQAFSSQSPSFKTLPQFYPLRIRGVLLEHLNREEEALSELRKAVNAAADWRQGALPGDATSTRTVVVLHDVYNDFAQLAAELSLKRQDPALAREGLETLAANRAANLREQIALAFSQKQRLPPQYFDLLSELQVAQARVTLGENRPQDKAKLEQIRLELARIGNDSGLELTDFTQKGERNSYRNSLRDIQARLSANEVLLSFSLGSDKSFLWAVTGNGVRVHKLPAESEIAGIARQFSQAVQHRQDTSVPGRRLSETLFGNLDPDVWRKPEWLIVGDGVLLGGVPFAGLTDLASATGSSFLIRSHDLRFIPSELLLLSSDKVRAQRRFVGVGDPIYNTADFREKSAGRVDGDAQRASMALPRLVGSSREVRSAAKQSGLPRSEILVGQQATVSFLQKAIAKQPEILHFAVHVVTPDMSRGANPGQGSQAALALSLTKEEMPELLTPEAIAALRVPGSLVILSGCSSQRGEILPSAGLMGLSRAWLLAGASAVMVSAWPTPDDSGQFFSSFYSHFDAVSSGTLAQRAAVALQQAQVEMEHGDGYRSSPKFWAAYSLISKE